MALAIVLVESIVAFGGSLESEGKDTSSGTAVVQNAHQKFNLVYSGKNVGNKSVNPKKDLESLLLNQHVKFSGGFECSGTVSGLPHSACPFAMLFLIDTKGSIEKTDNGPEQAIFKADILNINDDKKFRLAVLKEDERPVRVTIYDENNVRVFSETIKEMENFRKIYDLGQLEGEFFRFDLRHKGSKLSFDM